VDVAAGMVELRVGVNGSSVAHNRPAPGRAMCRHHHEEAALQGHSANRSTESTEVSSPGRKSGLRRALMVAAKRRALVATVGGRLGVRRLVLQAHPTPDLSEPLRAGQMCTSAAARLATSGVGRARAVEDAKRDDSRATHDPDPRRDVRIDLRHQVKRPALTRAFFVFAAIRKAEAHTHRPVSAVRTIIGLAASTALLASCGATSTHQMHVRLAPPDGRASSKPHFWGPHVPSGGYLGQPGQAHLPPARLRGVNRIPTTHQDRGARIPAPHRFNETARLSLTGHNGFVWTDSGVAAGSLPMTMTVVTNDLTRTASFTGRASAGSISGEMSMKPLSTSNGSIDFNGKAAITHGTGAFRDGKAKLAMQGELIVSVEHMKLVFSGVYYY
jgi:hypothetical protein